ncbi:MAG: hypothetical protein AAGG07_14355 [Planctomycetota bacterium]
MTSKATTDKYRGELAARLSSVTSGHALVRVAAETGVGPETVRRYLRGASTVPAEFISRVAVTYKARPEYLLTGDGPVYEWEVKQVGLAEHTSSELFRELLRREVERELGAAAAREPKNGAEEPVTAQLSVRPDGGRIVAGLAEYLAGGGRSSHRHPPGPAR